MKIIAESKFGLGDIVRTKKTQKIGVVTGIEAFVSFDSNYIQYEIDHTDFEKEHEIEMMGSRPETLTVTDKE